MARRLWWLKKCVRNSTAMTLRPSKAWPKQRQLGARVGARALHALGVPGGADLHALVDGVDVHVVVMPMARAPTSTVKGSMVPLACSVRRRSISARMRSGPGNARVPERRQLAILGGLDQLLGVRGVQRHQRHVALAQDQWLGPAHGNGNLR